MDAFFSILQCPMNVSQVSQKSYNNNAIKYFRAVAGVTLPKADSDFPAGSAAEVSGWGVTDAGDAADVLMLVAVHIDSDEGRFKFTMTNHKLCIHQHEIAVSCNLLNVDIKH